VALDEPTAGMDVEGRAATRELLRALHGDGVTVLLTSHDLADVEQTADRLAILDRGRIVALGRPAQLAGGAAARVRFRLATPLSQPDRVDLATGCGTSTARRARPSPTRARDATRSRAPPRRPDSSPR
jgi:ABC-2 type transport system ATP-binding protein